MNAERRDMDQASLPKLSVAPMMDWTDRHCRALHRVLSRNVLLYTEMITAGAIVHGDAPRLLDSDAIGPLTALQIGGSEPEILAQAARIASFYPFEEINLNVGCPSDRVKSGCFGAVLMKDPARVAECMAAIKQTVPSSLRVSVKCRLGVDDQVPSETLPRFLEVVSKAGVCDFTLHARMAWLKGLSPKENRDIPPLDYALVERMRAEFPKLRIGINGGITSLDAAEAFLAQGFDQVMIGRSAYHEPTEILLPADARIFGQLNPVAGPVAAVEAMYDYIDTELSKGVRLSSITRHMLGLFNGVPGARAWRRVLSEQGPKPGAGLETISEALSHVRPHFEARSATAVLI